ncbi:hypothetical protein KC19_1G102200 [Ceratodon purpureus]|uniref:Uncharacterized protein n=1 Tax=Ceratodon purpureus TaxID=3225 RepID=A0A8T0J4J9_CERPU|nr:hypothetical protein KC19_1G102200 [Ceratodon purpureus]
MHPPSWSPEARLRAILRNPNDEANQKLKQIESALFSSLDPCCRYRSSPPPLNPLPSKPPSTRVLHRVHFNLRIMKIV